MGRNSIRTLVVAAAACASPTSWASDLTYLQSLLAATPEGGWVKASSNVFSDAWPSGADLPPPVPGGPRQVILAWSGFAWDSHRGNLMLFGGGHENYVGNEVYLWQGSNGQWARGTLPSAVDLQTGLVVGNGAPQSSHTYQTNIYAPGTDRFVVFGGAAWNSGGNLVGPDGRTGPWWWDPAKADPYLVGGADGTGWDSRRAGANSWQARPYDPWVGLSAVEGLGYVYGTSAYRAEAGKDVIYLTMDQHGSGFPNLVRYQLGSVSTPDTWQVVGTMANSVAKSGAAAIDTSRGLFVRTARPDPGFGSDLAIFDLARNDPANPAHNVDFAVRLVDGNGVEVDLNSATSIAYDSVNDKFVIWDGRDRGTVWMTRPEYLTGGGLDPVWTLEEITSATAAQPVGNHGDGVLGKWKYIDELGAFIALDSYDHAREDSAVWLYKPLGSIPEPQSVALMLGGLVLVGAAVRSGRRRLGAPSS